MIYFYSQVNDLININQFQVPHILIPHVFRGVTSNKIK